MTTDAFTGRLSEYLDDELPPGERSSVEAHVAGCDACRATLEELRRVVGRARALDDRLPTADLWPGIAEHIGVVSLAARGARRRLSFTVPQLAAASVALALVSGGAVWLLGGRTHAPTATAATEVGRRPAPLINASAYPTDPRYAAQVAALERALQRGRSQLDTATVRIIEKNLKIIDRAIRDAQSALVADPASTYLNLHLAQEMRRKLELLREAANLAGARS